MSAGYLTLLAAVAPVFLIILAGYLIRRAGWLTAHADASLMRLIVNVLVPCLIFETVLGNRALENPGNLLLPPLVGFGTVAVGYALSYFAAPLFAVREPRQRRTFAFVVGIYNYGYVPLPLIRTLFDSQTTAVLFVHNVGVETALWTVGIALLSGGSSKPKRWTNILNAPLIAILAAVSMHLAGGETWAPHFVLQAIGGMSQAAIPLGLILTGATFADQMREPGEQKSGALSFGSVVLRLGALPILMLALARWLPCPIELRRVIVVQAAMPCAVIPVILAQHYDGDAATAMRIVLITSAIGLVTIPLWLGVGLRWIGS